jgi:glycine cleavage system aminomethyltransferase T/glycine/D-amino acid oxidase-like deaminating enzyme
MSAPNIQMKHHARVVVIGGGIAGCSVLYHLAKLGWTDVVLLERNELTSGSTWHSVGNTPMFTASLNILRVLKYSNELYASLEAETGQNVGYHQVGSLRLATTRDLLKWYRQLADMAPLAGVRHEVIDVKQALELNPLINPEGVLAAAHLHGDGYLDPASVTFALAKGARQRGAEIYRGTRVERITRTASGEWAIATNNGTFHAEIVVNAGGQWGREIGRMVGVELPLVPMEHQYVVTEAVPELKQLPREIPVTRDPERVFYMRQEGDGLLIGFFEANPIPWAVNGIPREFGQQLLPERVEHLEPDLLRAMERVPVLGRVGIKKIVNGPDAYTPDGAPIVGPVPGVPNFFVIAGFSLFGIANSGGTGRMCAEWIVEGTPSIDMWEYDVRRFGEYASRKTYLVAKAIEAYAMDYAVHYPHRERDAGRPLKTSPIHDLLAAQGAVFCARHGWERPLWFAPPGVEPRDELSFGHANWFPYVGAECRAVRERVGILDQTSFGKFQVSGPGATAWLNHMCANDINVPVGKIVVTQMLNEGGGIECDLTVTRVAENTYWVVTAAWTTTHDYAWLEWHLPRDGSVSLRDITDEYAVLSLMGPCAREVLSRVTDADLSNAAFPFMRAQEIFVGAAPVRAYRISYVGELGWELYMPLSYQRHVYQRLMDAGREFGIVNFGYRALDSLRLEKGYRFWGLDMNPLTTPLEAGLAQFVKWNKPTFRGRDALEKQKAEGVARTLECLVVQNNEAVPHAWEPIYADDKLISYVCSGEYGHCVGKTIVLAYLPREYSAPGTELSIKLFGERFPATVERVPLYDPTNARLKA